MATGAWGMSFATAKAIMLCQESLIEGFPEWFHAALLLFNRMALAALLMHFIFRSFAEGLKRREMLQGVELGLFGAFGMLFQTHAQNMIAASTSAFFTQFTCVFVPLVVAMRFRIWPPIRVLIACIMVLTGCLLLNGTEGGWVGFGIGEIETILGAALFTGQILAIERERYLGNDTKRVAAVMFLVKAAVILPFVVVGILLHQGPGPMDALSRLLHAYRSGPFLVMNVLITLVSTLYAYLAMTRWQACVSSTQAGLIYATEPVFATLWALFLPGWFSAFAGVSYANEQLSKEFLVGALLMVGANGLLIFRGHPISLETNTKHVPPV